MLQILLDILRPLSLELSLAAMLGGLFFGAFYNYKLKLPTAFIYHKLVTVWGFMGFIFLFRILAGGAVNPAGWIGVGLLFGLYCLFIWIGEKLALKVHTAYLKRKFKV